jgi:hypothetical protein
MRMVAVLKSGGGHENREFEHKKSFLLIGLLQPIGCPDMIPIMSSPRRFPLGPAFSQPAVCCRAIPVSPRRFDRSYFLDRAGVVHLQRFSSDGTAAVMQRAIAGSLLPASVFSVNIIVTRLPLTQ